MYVKYEVKGDDSSLDLLRGKWGEHKERKISMANILVRCQTRYLLDTSKSIAHDFSLLSV